MKLRCVDLFSGIGGLHKALADIVEPVAVCDINEVCRTILSSKMPPQCLVHSDVKKLSLIPLAGTIDIIIASSPCQGFSSLGSHKGLTDERSSLLLEVLRLVDEAQPKAIFLENVPGAIKYAMPSLIDELGNKRAYELRWACVPASHVGAPHRRLRWFCLATLPDVEWEFRNLHYKRYDWSQEPRRKEDRQKHLCMYPSYAQRLGLLGNSVVPDCVRWAFMFLTNGFAPVDIEADALSLVVPDYKEASQIAAGSPPPQFGYHDASGTYSMKPYPFTSPKLDLRLLVSRTLDVPGPRVSRKIPTEDMIRTSWATPRYSSNTYIGARTLTERTSNDLGTQLRFERGTPTDEMNWLVNPGFVEWLMGYDIGYTLISVSRDGVA